MNEKKFFTTKNVTYLSVLLALVIIFQLLASYMKVAGLVTLCPVLVPIVLGSIILGVPGGAFLGVAFGIVVIISTFMGGSPIALYLIDVQPLYVVVLLVKGIAAGVVPALLYKAISKKNERTAVFVAAAISPIVNTGIFILGMVMMLGVVTEAATASGVELGAFVLVVLVNFVVELLISIVLAPAAYKVVKITSNRRNTGA